MLRYFIVKRIYYEFQWTNCSRIGLVVADLSDFHCSHLQAWLGKWPLKSLMGSVSPTGGKGIGKVRSIWLLCVVLSWHHDQYITVLVSVCNSHVT